MMTIKLRPLIWSQNINYAIFYSGTAELNQGFYWDFTYELTTEIRVINIETGKIYVQKLLDHDKKCVLNTYQHILVLMNT